MLQTEGHRVSFRMRAQLIHKAFVGKRILNPQRRAQWSSEERRPHRMREGAFTADRSASATRAANTSREIRRHNIALVTQLAGGWLCWPWLQWFRCVAGQHTADHVARLIVARPITQRSYPPFPIPGHDTAVRPNPGSMFDHARRTQVLPHHLVPAREL